MYRTMLRTTGSLEVGQSNNLNVGDYLSNLITINLLQNNGFHLGGYGLIAFDLSRTYLPAEIGVTDVPKISDLQAHITFKSPLSETTSFIFVLVRY